MSAFERLLELLYARNFHLLISLYVKLSTTFVPVYI